MSGNSDEGPVNKSAELTTTVKLSLEVVRIKRIPQREFEQPATTVVTLTPHLVTYPNANGSMPLTSAVGGSGLRAAMALGSSSSNPSSPSRSGDVTDLAQNSGSGDGPQPLALSVTPNVFNSQQVFHDNDPYFNDRVEFVGTMPDDDDADAGGIIQGFPAGVTIPPIGPDGKPTKGGSPHASPPFGSGSAPAAAEEKGSPPLPSIPKPPTANQFGKPARKSVVSLLPPPTLPSDGTPSSGSVRRQSRSFGGDGSQLLGIGLTSLSSNSANNSSKRHSVTSLTLPSLSHTPHFRISVAVHDHNKPTTPLLILSGLLEIPAVQTKGSGEVTLSVALSPPSSGTSDDEVSATPMRDEIDVICPLFVIRYKVNVTKPAREPIDHHADVLLEDEPRYTPDQQLVPDVTQYSWYHLLNDRAWLQGFSHALISQWSALPKIVYEGERTGSKSPKKKGVGAPSFGGTRPGSSTRRSSTAPAVNYTSIADLMINHWSVRRSHEAVTRIRMVSDKYCRGEHMGFTALEEYRLKLQWRERQVLRTAMAVDLLSDYSGSQVRVLLDRLWLNMVYGVPADDPSPPTLTYDMRNKLQNISFTNKHAAILRACMLQHLIHGLNYNDALKIATEDFEPKNVTYVSRRGSQVGGEYVKSEAIMMAFGQPSKPTAPPPIKDVSEIEQIHRLLENNKKNIKAHQRRSKSRERRDREGGGDGGDGGDGLHAGTMRGSLGDDLSATTLNGTLNSTMLASTYGSAAGTLALAGVTVKESGAIDFGVGPNGCPRREVDFPTPTTYTSQKVFTTVVIDFVGRLLETLTDHEFIMILTAFIPAVTAASEKCLMVASGVPSSYKALPKRGSSAKKRGSSARRKTKRSSSVVGGGSGNGGADIASAHISGPVQIEYLDALGRKLPKKDKKRLSVAGSASLRNETAIVTEEGGDKREAMGSSAAVEGRAPASGDGTNREPGGAAQLTHVGDHVMLVGSEDSDDDVDDENGGNSEEGSHEQPRTPADASPQLVS